MKQVRFAAAITAATALLSAVANAGIYTVDFRQQLDPARVSVSSAGNFQQARTADGLRMWTDTGGWATVYVDMSGLAASGTRIEGDFSATMAYSHMAGFNQPGYDQQNRVVMLAPWGSFSGESYIIQRTFSRNWVTDLYPDGVDQFAAARNVSDNGVREWYRKNGNGFVLGGAGTLTIERVGSITSFYAHGELLGAGAVDASRGIPGFALQMLAEGRSPIDLTFDSFSVSGPSVIPEPTLLALPMSCGLALMRRRR
jgi:hypothetical protein